MGAWKSSDGGSISLVGKSNYTGTPTAGSILTVVSGATNVSGLVLRTAVIRHIGTNVEGRVLAGAIPIAVGRQSGTGSLMATELPREVFLPAGMALQVEATSGTSDFYLTYDLL